MKNNFANKKVAIVGLGLEGKDLANFLLKQKALVSIYDQKPKEDLDLTELDSIKEINFVCGENYLSQGFDDFDVIFRSPGVYRYISEFKKAEKKGVEISSAIKLFFDLCPAKTIGITGTKGKGTTSTLIYEALKKSGKNVFLVGNIGKPYLELLGQLTEDDWVVLEMSSFQLIDLNKSPHIAVVLNITVDHLDWHKSRKEYVDAKKNIVKKQNRNDFAVINVDYKTPQSFFKETKAQVFFFSRSKEVKGSFVRQGKIILNLGKEQVIGETKKLILRGEHNWENITAAICASALAGVDLKSIQEVIFNFKGLEHRLELVGTIRGVSFYNDSFATNPQPTIAAIEAFTEPIHLILGGSDKGLDYIEMANYLSKKGNIKSVVLIGDIADQIEVSLKKAGFKNELVNFSSDKKMAEIVKYLFEKSQKGDVILLSPASASFGMFTDYKDRGNQFKTAVKSLKNS